MVRLALAISRQLRGRCSKSQERRTGGGFNRRCPISWEPYERGIQKISWGTSEFVEWAACEILSRSETVLSGDVPSDCHLASFRHARFFDFSTKSAETGHSPGIRTEVRIRISLHQCSMRCRASTASRCQRPSSDTLESISGRLSRGLQSSLFGQGRTVPPVVIPGVWRPSPKNFRKILDLSTRASRSGHGVVVLTNVTREKALARERANTSAALELTPSS